MNDSGNAYCGRFAPSPTGSLHFGSLVAALGSFLEARHRGGRWLLRMDDVDRPRCSQAAADSILRALDAFELRWDGEVVWQGQRTAAYADAFERLKDAGLLYPCCCTRRELADSAIAADGSTRYPGTCRAGLPPGREARAWRLRVDAARIAFDDAIQGPVSSALTDDSGDFILKRADGLFAYQLAVVVDDAAAGVTHVVRGADLLPSTPRQVYLQGCLGLPTPAYAHLPVAVNAAGEKLSKQTLALPVDAARPAPALHAALVFLGQRPPRELAAGVPRDILAWANPNWDIARVPRGPLPAEPAAAVG